MPEGRASTGSESRRWIADYRCAHGHRFAISVESLDGHTAKCAVCGTITVEVVERDHDERAEGLREEFQRVLLEERVAFTSRAPVYRHQVEAQHQRILDKLITVVAERFNLTEGRDDDG